MVLDLDTTSSFRLGKGPGLNLELFIGLGDWKDYQEASGILRPMAGWINSWKIGWIFLGLEGEGGSILKGREIYFSPIWEGWKETGNGVGRKVNWGNWPFLGLGRNFNHHFFTLLARRGLT